MDDLKSNPTAAPTNGLMARLRAGHELLEQLDDPNDDAPDLRVYVERRAGRYLAVVRRDGFSHSGGGATFAEAWNNLMGNRGRLPAEPTR